MPNVFQIVVMGCTGGPFEGNLSGYLLSPIESEEWIAFDAGTLLDGIEEAVSKKSFQGISFTDPDLRPAGEILLKHLKAYLISHAHLDHIAGLILNSQVDTHKYILGIDPTIDNLRDHIFNGRIWPNYGNEGFEPILNKYQYVRLPLHELVSIPETSMQVETYLLSHPHGYPSAAFLIEYKGEYMLYFGDTSSDTMEIEKHVARVWRRIAPLIQEGKFRGMLLECSFPQKDARQAMFGHLDTRLMMLELHHLADLAQTSLEGLNVIVTHLKESLYTSSDPKKSIIQELTEMNHLGINFIFPDQGDRILL